MKTICEDNSRGFKVKVSLIIITLSLSFRAPLLDENRGIWDDNDGELGL